jgi:hypothetical protein
VIVSERCTEPAEDAWTELDRAEDDDYWASFNARYGFRAGDSPEAWPAINEPVPSVTFDLSVIADGPQRGAAYDAINAEALRAFVWSLPDADLVVLDWQHPAYRFRPAIQALTCQPEWRVPVYPDGDYYVFLTRDLVDGTFGHPWEQTLCVMGERLGASLGRSLATWLPIKRRNGLPT